MGLEKDIIDRGFFKLASLGSQEGGERQPSAGLRDRQKNVCNPVETLRTWRKRDQRAVVWIEKAEILVATGGGLSEYWDCWCWVNRRRARTDIPPKLHALMHGLGCAT